MTLRNQERELYSFRLRLAIAFGVILLACGLLIARFVYLQVVQYEHYHTLAEANRISILPVVPNRGLIVDRNGSLLAHNYSAYTLEITPSKVGKLDETMDLLSTVVEITPKDRRRFKKLLEESRNFESLPIRTRLSEEEVARFAVNRYRFPGVDIKARLFREYPFGTTASHALGYIGRINAADVERLDGEEKTANYRGSDHIGKIGLEQSYEDELHGITGFERVETDAGGRAVRSLSRIEPISGNNLILTLDIRLQEVAEHAFGQRRGALVAIEPQTGEILAFVSQPGFDPNLFIDGIDQTNWDLLNTSLDKPLNNRALRGQYPPGSTIKPFMALAGLASGKRNASYAISDPGFFSLPGISHRYRDWKPGGHGIVDLHKSIVVSCDTYYYSLATDMGVDLIYKFLNPFGFGKKTGIDIDGELPGILPSQEWKQKRFKQRWYQGDTVSVGIGQGYNLATPLQLAYATATLANNGVAMRPRLVKAIKNSQTGDARELTPEPLHEVDFRPEHLELVKAAMVDVLRPGGTAALAAKGAGYVIAGKTGTAQVIGMKQGEKYVESRIAERFRDHALFVAFAPAESPKLALAVLVENGGHGGSAAAPIARQVFDYYLLGKKPSKPAEEAPEESESD
ncbi:MAG TPA: penicillin-binding protein 2 [Burkholderiales bacterium]|nr:penicillin-binding protein 2 [Burkholderiales bacterium]